ncbi:hypothetical protein HDV63DRAFT_372442 [Trichoderma sp. SZMC 28014]
MQSLILFLSYTHILFSFPPPVLQGRETSPVTYLYATNNLKQINLSSNDIKKILPQASNSMTPVTRVSTHSSPPPSLKNKPKPPFVIFLSSFSVALRFWQTLLRDSREP